MTLEKALAYTDDELVEVFEGDPAARSRSTPNATAEGGTGSEAGGVGPTDVPARAAAQSPAQGCRLP
jgi:hypothetical protein